MIDIPQESTSVLPKQETNAEDNPTTILSNTVKREKEEYAASKQKTNKSELIAKIVCVCSGSSSISGACLPYLDNDARFYRGGGALSSLETEECAKFITAFCRLPYSSGFVVIREGIDPSLSAFISLLPDDAPIRQLLAISDVNGNDGIDELSKALSSIGAKCLYDSRNPKNIDTQLLPIDSLSLKPQHFPSETLEAFTKVVTNKQLNDYRIPAGTVLTGRGCNLNWIGTDSFNEATLYAYRDAINKRYHFEDANFIESNIVNDISEAEAIRALGFIEVITRQNDVKKRLEEQQKASIKQAAEKAAATAALEVISGITSKNSSDATELKENGMSDFDKLVESAYIEGYGDNTIETDEYEYEYVYATEELNDEASKISDEVTAEFEAITKELDNDDENNNNVKPAANDNVTIEDTVDDAVIAANYINIDSPAEQATAKKIGNTVEITQKLQKFLVDRKNNVNQDETLISDIELDAFDEAVIPLLDASPDIPIKRKREDFEDTKSFVAVMCSNSPINSFNDNSDTVQQQSDESIQAELSNASIASMTGTSLIIESDDESIVKACSAILELIDGTPALDRKLAGETVLLACRAQKEELIKLVDALPDEYNKLIKASENVTRMYLEAIENNLVRDLSTEETLKYLNDYARDNNF